MHGRPRKAAKAEDLNPSAAKAEILRQLQSQLLHNHKHRIYDDEAMEICSKLLEINPEFYTAWNFRKIAVQKILTSCGDPEVAKSVRDRELEIAEIALRRKPKCYAPWYHRKWILKQGYEDGDIEREFGLLDQLLTADSRNFHGWNHLRFVAATSNSTEEELNFTTDRINADYSNYSAWHNRSAILSNSTTKNFPGSAPKEKVIKEELELIHQAISTDPDNHSGWFYHLGLLEQLTDHDPLTLISTWPSQDSEIILSSNSRALPIILYFNKPIKCADWRAVTVESVFTRNGGAVFKPLSLNAEEARCYVAYINIDYSGQDLNSSERYSVKVNTNDACSYEFFVKIIPNIQELNVFLWDDAEFSRADLLQTGRLTGQSSGNRVSEWRSEALSAELMHFQEMVSEIKCKMAKLTLARLMVKDRKQLGGVLNMYDDLIKLDPSHDGYYKDQRSLILMEQITLDEESLKKHSFLLKESPLKISCIRLNNLSLTCIGSVDSLLWVNILDLSHNKLHSIQGLEAMQLLSHLNLSHNKLDNMTSLEPLRLMTSLRVLNVSYNEIEAHTVDSRRYLSGSLPLSHLTRSHGYITKFDDYHGEEINLHWDVIVIFKDMHLRQLDIMGNRILTEFFRALMIKLMPSLRWFDGYHIP